MDRSIEETPLWDAIRSYATGSYILTKHSHPDDPHHADAVERAVSTRATLFEEIAALLAQRDRVREAAEALLCASRAAGVLGATEITIHEEALAAALADNPSSP